jgi:hypothetical protein
MKRLLFCVFVGIILCLQITISFAQDDKPREMIRAPHFYALGKVNSNDALKMECEGQGPLYPNITCTFTHVTITKKTEAELAEERKKRQLDSSKMSDKDFNIMKTSPKKEKITKERLALLNSLTPEKKGYSDRIMTMAQNIDKSTNKTELFNIINDFSEFVDRCCSIGITTWQAQFEKVSQYKWISNPGPQGLCNVVRIKTLEANDDMYLLWKLTEITVSVDVDKTRNDMFDKICSGIEINKPTVYSWDVPTDMIMDCQCIKFLP